MNVLLLLVAMLAVMGLARPQILVVTSAITERAVALQASLGARLRRKLWGSDDAPGA